MNPQIMWDQLLAAYAAGDWNRIDDRARTLLDWLDLGGFPPTVHPRLDNDWNQALAKAGCQYALEALHARWSCASVVPREQEQLHVD